jgi:AcrR family transcriptional regulator
MNKNKADTREGAIREFILDKSEEIFSELGFEKASMDAIAAHCGLSKPTLYAYFKNKQALFSAIHLRIQGQQYEQAIQIISSGADPYHILSDCIDQFFTVMAAKKEILHLLVIESSHMPHHELHAHFDWHNRNMVEITKRLTKILGPIIKPEIKQKFPLPVIVNHLINQLQGILMIHAFTGDTEHIAAGKELLMHQWQHGLLDPQPH